jgi:hypothetical protein
MTSPFLSDLLLRSLGHAAELRHKVFISHYHKDDWLYKALFELSFGKLFVTKSVKPGDIDSDLSTDYIKQLIQQEYISNASVVLVLVGPKTKCRKHVDWEISAGLNKKVGGYSGLLGVLLPTFPLLPNDQYRYQDVPSRLADNAQSGYAQVYTWTWLASSPDRVKEAINTAYDARVSKSDKIINSRLQMINNTRD